jgi:hypothetical protein
MANVLRRTLICAVVSGCLIVPLTGHGQVIISLLLGDKLNSGQVEFGLDGGLSVISQAGTGGSTRNTFNLGFYFDIKMKSSWMIHTGVIVKSTMGGGEIPVYALGDAQLDGLFANGHVERTMNYFNVPIFIKYNFKNNMFLEAGPMLGLKYGAKDKFIAIVNGDELTYEVDVNNKFKALDAGLSGGIGYRLMHGNGMNLGVRYYHGLVNVSKEGGELFNRCWYLTVGIPIGAGKTRDQQKQD